MPIIKSARKRVKVAAKATARNVKTKRLLRSSMKALTQALESGKHEEITKAHRAATSTIDKAVKKAIMHKNRGARKKAQLAALVKSGHQKSVTSATKKAGKKPTTTKAKRSDKKDLKAEPKKTPAKKP